MISSSFRLSIGLDKEDIATLQRIGNPSLTLWPQYVWAMGESLNEVEYQAQEWMYGHFMNPTGRLEDAFEKHVYGPFDAELWNDMPYAQRRNYGFTDMTDSIGRYYAWDGGIAWAQNAIANSYPEVEATWHMALDRALGRI